MRYLYSTRHIQLLILALLAAATLSGCGQIKAIYRADEIERTTRINQLRFLERVSDAYFLIGNEYYNLALEAEKNGRMEQKEDFANKASVYLLFCKNVRKDAEDLRAALEAQETKGWANDMGLWTKKDPVEPVSPEEQTFAAPGTSGN